MTRAILPTRRQNVTVATDWQGHPLTVTIGFNDDQPAEVFADTPKGGQMQATLSDACVLISIALQHGIPPAALAKSLARQPDPFTGAEAPASPIGAIMEAITKETRE